jgi:hypothetical protein
MEKRESAKDRVVRQSYNPGMALNDILSLLDAEIARFKVARAMLAPDQWLPQLHGKLAVHQRCNRHLRRFQSAKRNAI